MLPGFGQLLGQALTAGQGLEQSRAQQGIQSLPRTYRSSSRAQHGFRGA